MNINKKDQLRIRSKDELSKQMDGLLVLSKILDKILDSWFLSGGTLLGAYRDKDFIPWDWDVEVTVFSEEAIEKEGFLMKKLISAGFKIISSDSSLENFKIVAEGWGTEYEILGRYLKMPDNFRARLMTEVPARFFEKVKYLNFRGYEFPVPYPTDDFLKALYGDWFTPNKTADKKSYFSTESYRLGKIDILRKIKTKISSYISPSCMWEFPLIQKKDIDQFQSWDLELGWCNKPNIVRVDKSDYFYRSKKNKSGLSVYSIDDKGSRVCSYPSLATNTSFFGDDFCMSRDVNDEETFTWHLGKLRKARISNYGVYDFGLDQALLRLKRDFNKDPAESVVLSVSTSTMARCNSVYKNYLEPSPSFMVKPRFEIIDKKFSSKLIRNPITNKEELLNIRKYKSHFKKYDKHYTQWHYNRIKHYIFHLIRHIFFRGKNSKNLYKVEKQFKYEISFWKSDKILFLSMMNLFHHLSQSYGFKPIFLLQHSKPSLEFCLNTEREKLPWNDTITSASKIFPNIKFIDSANCFIKNDNIENLYDEYFYSQKANKLLADYLNYEI